MLIVYSITKIYNLTKYDEEMKPLGRRGRIN
jgi:hypothetical protein